VFGYPVVFKRNSPQVNRKIQREFKTLQHGQRCIFVGFPNNQAGWLIFVQEKILGSHLIVSMDVVFDQYFMSGITASIQGYTGSQMTKKIGNNSGQKPRIMEETGTITNLTDTQISHWGEKATFESDHRVAGGLKSNECNKQNLFLKPTTILSIPSTMMHQF
jgi:hypothetical protein